MAFINLMTELFGKTDTFFNNVLLSCHTVTKQHDLVEKIRRINGPFLLLYFDKTV